MVFKRGPWTPEEDALLLIFVTNYGPANWNSAHRIFPDLRRSGKTCRSRYLTQVRPAIRGAPITPAEERTILVAHSIVGNQWSQIARLLPGRTATAVQNVVNSRLQRALQQAASINIARMVAAGMPWEHKVALAEMHDAFSASSPGSYSTPVAVPATHGAAGGIGGDIEVVSSSAGSSMEIFNNMPVTQSNRVVLAEITNIDVDAAPTNSYHEWAMPALLSVQEPQERLSSSWMLPSVQNSTQSPSLGSSELPSVQAQQRSQADMAYLSSIGNVGYNDLVEGTDYTSTSQLLAEEENLVAIVESLMMDGATASICDDMWSSMPAARDVGESASDSDDFIPDFM